MPTKRERETEPRDYSDERRQEKRDFIAQIAFGLLGAVGAALSYVGFTTITNDVKLINVANRQLEMEKKDSEHDSRIRNVELDLVNKSDREHKHGQK